MIEVLLYPPHRMGVLPGDLGGVGEGVLHDGLGGLCKGMLHGGLGGVSGGFCLWIDHFLSS